MKEPRLLKANEIDVRVGSINDKGATLLLYKDARVDMNVLDETYGPENWQRDHKEVKGNVYCGIGIHTDNGWAWKWDVGVESQSEAIKGEASDSFKRAGFNWGIGRELYSAPFTWISADNYTSFKNPKTGKLGTYDKFVVEKIGYNDNREINQLVIKNSKTGKVVFTLGKTERPPTDYSTSGSDQEILALAKSDIFKELVKQNYKEEADQKAFIKFAIGKESIDTIEEAREVAKSLESQE